MPLSNAKALAPLALFLCLLSGSLQAQTAYQSESFIPDQQLQDSIFTQQGKAYRCRIDSVSATAVYLTLPANAAAAVRIYPRTHLDLSAVRRLKPGSQASAQRLAGLSSVPVDSLPKSADKANRFRFELALSTGPSKLIGGFHSDLPRSRPWVDRAAGLWTQTALRFTVTDRTGFGLGLWLDNRRVNTSGGGITGSYSLTTMGLDMAYRKVLLKDRAYFRFGVGGGLAYYKVDITGQFYSGFPDDRLRQSSSGAGAPGVVFEANAAFHYRMYGPIYLGLEANGRLGSGNNRSQMQDGASVPGPFNRSEGVDNLGHARAAISLALVL